MKLEQAAADLSPCLSSILPALHEREAINCKSQAKNLLARPSSLT
jgi:hypothetical protein